MLDTNSFHWKAASPYSKLYMILSEVEENELASESAESALSEVESADGGQNPHISQAKGYLNEFRLTFSEDDKRDAIVALQEALEWIGKRIHPSLILHEVRQAELREHAKETARYLRDIEKRNRQIEELRRELSELKRRTGLR